MVCILTPFRKTPTSALTGNTHIPGDATGPNEREWRPQKEQGPGNGHTWLPPMLGLQPTVTLERPLSFSEPPFLICRINVRQSVRSNLALKFQSSKSPKYFTSKETPGPWETDGPVYLEARGSSQTIPFYSNSHCTNLDSAKPVRVPPLWASWGSHSLQHFFFKHAFTWSCKSTPSSALYSAMSSHIGEPSIPVCPGLGSFPG